MHKRDFKNLKSVTLTDESRKRIKAHVYAFVSTHPAQQQSKVQLFTRIHLGAAPVAAVLLISLTAGTAFAAQDALPGEPLYPVKTGVNERVQEMVAIQPEAKAHVNAKILERRLEEVEQLAAQGRLKEEVKEQMEDRINQRAQMFMDTLEVLATSTAQAIQLQLALNLEVHEEVVETIADNFENSEGLHSIAARVRLMRRSLQPVVAQEPAIVTATIMSAPQAESMVAVEQDSGQAEATQYELERLQEEYAQLKEEIHAAAQKDIEEKIEETQKALREGSIMQRSANTQTAQDVLNQAHNKIHQARKIKEIHAKLKLKENVEAQSLIELPGEVRGVQDFSIQEPKLSR